MRGADDATDLVCPLLLEINNGEDIRRGTIAGAIGLLEELPPARVERLVGPEHPRRRDLLADGAGDAPRRVEKGVVLLASLGAKPAVEALTDPVNSAEQDAALAENVRLV